METSEDLTPIRTLLQHSITPLAMTMTFSCKLHLWRWALSHDVEFQCLFVLDDDNFHLYVKFLVTLVSLMVSWFFTFLWQSLQSLNNRLTVTALTGLKWDIAWWWWRWWSLEMKMKRICRRTGDNVSFNSLHHFVTQRSCDKEMECNVTNASSTPN